MKSNDMIREEISAFSDGELAPHRCDEVARKLRQPAEQDCWDLYHKIGDTLRSDDMADCLSAGFSARMAARLDLEPAFISRRAETRTPDSRTVPSHNELPALIVNSGRWTTRRKLFVPGLAVAAAVVYLGMPRLMVATDSFSGKPPVELAMKSGGDGSSFDGLMVVQGANKPSPERVEVLRDSRMDEYLLAHQQFSPSLYSSAQFARSATFATNTGK